jgi:hypothetical protein
MRRLVTIASLLLIIVAAVYPINTFIVSDDNHARELVFTMPSSGKAFLRLWFIHSSELTPWLEIWAINTSGIWVYAICFKGEGAGHPASPKDFNRGQFTVNDSFYCFNSVFRYLGRSVIVCGKTALNMSLEFNGLRIPINSCISIKVKRMFLIQLLTLKLKSLFMRVVHNGV